MNDKNVYHEILGHLLHNPMISILASQDLDKTLFFLLVHAG